MDQPMTDERREEICKHDASYETVRSILGRNSAETHRHELLAETTRLRDELDSAESSAARSHGREYELLNEIGQFKARQPGFPTVTICGSMRFYPRMLKVAAKLTAAGQIVLMPHDASLTGIENKTAIEHGAMLDEMHRAKIRLSQSVYIVNSGGYIGESTRGEIEYAARLGLPVAYDDSAAEAERGEGGVTMSDSEICEGEFIDGIWRGCGCADCLDEEDDEIERQVESGHLTEPQARARHEDIDIARSYLDEGQ